MHSRISLRRRGRQRRQRKKLKFLLLLFGTLCICVSGGLFVLALLHGTPELRSLALAYLGLGAGLLALRGLAELFGLLRHLMRREGRTGEAHSGGFALIMVLVLLSCLTVVAMQVQVHARLALRRAHQLSSLAQLRAAATDGAWEAIRRLATASARGPAAGTGLSAESPEQADPAGIETRVSLSETNSAALPYGLAAARQPPAGRLWVVEATARREEARSAVRGLVQVGAPGDVRIVMWVEDL